MTSTIHTTFSPKLDAKIHRLKNLQTPLTIGSLKFDSPLLLAPMAGICNAPFRKLMQDLGAGGTVSELISCHGINYKNHRTLEMLKLFPGEKNMGIQLFGENPAAMREAAVICESFGPQFIDINMGCPVNKVVSKGGGSALLKETQHLFEFFSEIKKTLKIPLTIKIRTGWDQNHRNALEVIKIAKESGIDFVAIHGRTRAQQYTGLADWDFIEDLAQNKILPLIGNGDLHTPNLVHKRLLNTNCNALMIARGALRNPFIFLESLDPEILQSKKSHFEGEDYFEVIKKMYSYYRDFFTDERLILVQIRKLIVWFAAGFPHAAVFRSQQFSNQNLADCLKISEDYFLSLQGAQKQINFEEVFMSSGHG